ncbi:hypothetical protein [Pseudoalteromonas obscura]|uniref:hypothetical protein n=1 Tax=Pseudoalteromonas obscura TaxID=3048491 RepID=UPI0024DE4F98|nr:hypothetical protein [Pseudoalteromonas sp. P94(2023)]
MREGVSQHIDEVGNFINTTDKSLSDIIGEIAKLECQTRQVIARAEQDFRSPKTWIGSDSENVLTLLSALMATVSALASACASHTHSGVKAGPDKTPAPDQAGDFNDHASQADDQKARLDPITK